MLAKFKFKAIFFSFIAGFILSEIIDPLVTVAFRSMDIINRNYSRFSGRFFSDLLENSNYLATLVVADSLCYMGSGFVLARYAGKNFILNASVLCAMWVSFGIVLLPFSTQAPDWFNILDTIVAIPATFLGGKLAEARMRNRY